MSVEALAYAKMTELGDAEGFSSRLLFYIIAENTYNDSGLCRLGKGELATQMRCNPSTITRQCAALESVGIIKVHPRSEGARGRLPDDIEILGFRAWLINGRSSRGVPQYAEDEGNSPIPQNAIVQKAGLDRNPANQTSQSCNKAGLDKESVQGSVQDSPPTPSGERGGKVLGSGWSRGWTEKAQDAVESLRNSADDYVVEVVETFIDRVRGLLGPPRDADPVAYVRQLAVKLKAFDQASLARAAQTMLDTRSRDLPSVVHVEAACRGEAVGKKTGARVITRSDPEWAILQAHYDRSPRCEAFARLMRDAKKWTLPDDYSTIAAGRAA